MLLFPWRCLSFSCSSTNVSFHYTRIHIVWNLGTTSHTLTLRVNHYDGRWMDFVVGDDAVDKIDTIKRKDAHVGNFSVGFFHIYWLQCKDVCFSMNLFRTSNYAWWFAKDPIIEKKKEQTNFVWKEKEKQCHPILFPRWCHICGVWYTL